MEELRLILEIGQNASTAAIGVAFAWAVSQMLAPGLICLCTYKVFEVIARVFVVCSPEGKTSEALLGMATKLGISDGRRELTDSERARTLAQLEVAVELLMEGEDDENE